MDESGLCEKFTLFQEPFLLCVLSRKVSVGLITLKKSWKTEKEVVL